MIDEEGAPVPLASVLSPVSLAGCTCVDSTFSPQFVPVSDFSLTCHSMQIALIHIPPSNPGNTQYITAVVRNGAVVEHFLSLSSCFKSLFIRDSYGNFTFSYRYIHCILFIRMVWAIRSGLF